MRGKHFEEKKKIKKFNKNSKCKYEYDTLIINLSKTGTINTREAVDKTISTSNSSNSISTCKRTQRYQKKEKSKGSSLNKFLVILGYIGMLVCLAIIIIYSYKIFEWYQEKQSHLHEKAQITNLVTIETTESTEEDVVGSTDKNKNNPYWDYITMDLMDVDFSKLLDQNPDTVAWIKVNGTNVNYPVVQTDNNKYYLKHSFYKKSNNAGWIFLDYRNEGLSDKNTVIYGHNREDAIMFGTLDRILKKDWQSNTDNHIVQISTATENTMWQVFSVYHVKASSDYIQTEFSSKKKYQEFLDLIISRSMYNFNTTVTTEDKVLTLSTCLNRNDERIVLHAKLIKRSEKEKIISNN